MKVALFIGRFQPLHKGHLHAIKEAMKKYEVILAVGSVNKRNLENPFSFEERKEMIRRAGIKCNVIGVKDFTDDKKWRDNLLKRVSFDLVISGSKWVKDCFKDVKKVIQPSFLKKYKYNGSYIRKKILERKEWKSLVPKEVAEYLLEINGEERIRKLAGKNRA